MDVMMHLLLLFVILVLITRVVFPFVIVGFALNDAMQVSEQEYQEVAALLKKHPKLKPAVEKAMADRLITREEMSDIKKEVALLEVDEAIQDARNPDSH